MSEGRSRKVRKWESPEVERKAERPKRKAVRLKSEEENTSEIVISRPDLKTKSATDIAQPELKEQPTAYLKRPTESMEVHHHPEVEKKTFKQYVLEGLMIFLAVMMGFFAESYREHINDRNKEHDYMISLVRDLKSDIGEAKLIQRTKLKGINSIDSVLLTFEKGDYKSKTAELYYCARQLGLRNYFKPNDGTILQLNNAGGLRLIHKLNVLDSLQHYINQVKDLLSLQETEETQLAAYKESSSLVFDAQAMNKLYAKRVKGQASLQLKKLDYNPPLISYDKKDINILLMRAVLIKGIRLSQINYSDLVINKANLLMKLVIKEYNLDDE